MTERPAMRRGDRASPTAGQRLRPVRLPASLDATLVLVRHGESTWIAEHRFQGRADPPLSPLGERQAALVAARLARPSGPLPVPIPAGLPVAIWHSPLARATQTADAIGRALGETHGRGVERRARPGFGEIAQGAWEGMPSEEVATVWAHRLAGWRRDPVHVHAPGGESLAEAADRVRSDLLTILGELSPTSSGASSGASSTASSVAPSGPSSRPSRSFVPGYGGLPDGTPWGIVVAHDGIFRLALLALLGLPLGRFWRFPFLLCAISVIEIRDGAAVLRCHNLAAHLAPLAAEPTAEAETEERARRGAL